MVNIRYSLLAAAILPIWAEPLFGADVSSAPPAAHGTFRKPANDAELGFWLENMIVHHRYTRDEVIQVTGISAEALADAVHRLRIDRIQPGQTRSGAVLKVLPYPGGRHPRIGFLEGAIHPQRETKISIFTPWDPAGYVVVDVPEAIFSNLGLTYLAHTHIPTVWDRDGKVLPVQEWKREGDGMLSAERILPNGIRFGARVEPRKEAVYMSLWLKNGTGARLTGLRVQNCVMLKGVTGFNQQTNDNKILQAPYAAVGSADRKRWIVTAWEPLHRVWANPPVPCMHSDPLFPDCDPGETVRLRGALWFHEGTNIQAEIKRLDATDWRTNR